MYAVVKLVDARIADGSQLWMEVGDWQFRLADGSVLAPRSDYGMSSVGGVKFYDSFQVPVERLRPFAHLGRQPVTVGVVIRTGRGADGNSPSPFNPLVPVATVPITFATEAVISRGDEPQSPQSAAVTRA